MAATLLPVSSMAPLRAMKPATPAPAATVRGFTPIIIGIMAPIPAPVSPPFRAPFPLSPSGSIWAASMGANIDTAIDPIIPRMLDCSLTCFFCSSNACCRCPLGSEVDTSFPEGNVVVCGVEVVVGRG